MSSVRYFGYHRVSTKEQHEDRGRDGIKQYCQSIGIDIRDKDIYIDKQSGKEYDRTEFNHLKRAIGDGDVLIVWEMDRLGRTKAGILKELEYFKEQNVRVIFLDIDLTKMDFSKMEEGFAKEIMKIIQDLIIQIFAAQAEAELKRKEKRQREGIAAKKERGEWDDYGRPQRMTLDEFGNVYERVLKGELRPKDCKTILGLPESTYYDYKNKYEKERLNLASLDLKKLQ